MNRFNKLQLLKDYAAGKISRADLLTESGEVFVWLHIHHKSYMLIGKPRGMDCEQFNFTPEECKAFVESNRNLAHVLYNCGMLVRGEMPVEIKNQL